MKLARNEIDERAPYLVRLREVLMSLLSILRIKLQQTKLPDESIEYYFPSLSGWVNEVIQFYGYSYFKNTKHLNSERTKFQFHFKFKRNMIVIKVFLFNLNQRQFRLVNLKKWRKHAPDVLMSLLHTEKTTLPFPFTLNGIWSWWLFSFLF